MENPTLLQNQPAAADRKFHEDGTLPSSGIFVFGSNEDGRHGKGAALIARNRFGAVYGVGRGRTGNAYAIPTKHGRPLRSLPVAAFAPRIAEFIEYARSNPNLTFFVTRVGCGLAGHADAHVAPLFASAPSNCSMPSDWRPYL